MNYSKTYDICPKCGNQAIYFGSGFTNWNTDAEKIIPSYVKYDFGCECGCDWTTTIYLQATKMKKEITNE